MTRRIVHECCVNARRNLYAYKTSRGYTWKLGNPTIVSVLYCPWCGVELEKERRHAVADLSAELLSLRLVRGAAVRDGDEYECGVCGVRYARRPTNECPACGTRTEPMGE